jgi:hypothetical protein
MAKTISVLVLVVAAVGAGATARAADKAGGKGACYFASTGACWEKYTPDMCETQKFTPGADCPTANRAGSCKTGDGRVMRLYKDKYDAKNAASYCSMLSGKFDPK